MTTVEWKRSKIYQNIFDDEFMMETFGTLRPDISTRTAHFFQLWMDWRPRRLVLSKTTRHTDVKRFLTNMGLRDLREFQLRNNEIRFCSAEDMAMATLNGLRDVI